MRSARSAATPEVVGDEQDARAGLFAQLVELIEDLPLHGDVQGAGRLVGDDQLRSADHRDRDQHALAHAAGELVRILPGTHPCVGEARALERLDRLFRGGLPIGEPVHEEHLGHLGADPHHRVEAHRGVLRDESDPLPADRGELGAGRSHEVDAIEVEVAEQQAPHRNGRGGGQQPHDRVRGGGLARTGLADDRDGLTGSDLERDVADGLDRAARGAVGHREVFDAEDGGAPGCGGHRTLRSGSSARDSRFADSTVRAITMPGNVVSHQADRR